MGWISSLTASWFIPYIDGVNLFPSRTPETVQPCHVAYLDGWEHDNEEVGKRNQGRQKDPQSGRTEWLVGCRGCAAGSDLWIVEIQMIAGQGTPPQR